MTDQLRCENPNERSKYSSFYRRLRGNGGRWGIVDHSFGGYGSSPKLEGQVFSEPILERLGSPPAVEDERVAKKVRNETVLVNGVGVIDSMEIEHVGLAVDGLNGATDAEQISTRAWDSPFPRVRASYATMVRNSSNRGQQSFDPDDLMPDKVVVRDEDCVVDRSGAFPKIQFADHVQEQIDLKVCPKDQNLNVAKSSSTPRELKGGPRSLSDVDDGNLFGPWMIVDKCRRRSQFVLSGDKRGTNIASGSGGSRIAALDMDAMDDEQVGIVTDGAYTASNPSKKSKASKVVVSGAKVIPIKPGNSVVVVEHRSTKNAPEHQVVSFLEHGHGNSAQETNMGSKNRGIKLKLAKKNSRQWLMIWKPVSAKTASRPVLTEWVENVNAQLNSIEMQHLADPNISSRLIVNQGVHLKFERQLLDARSKGHCLWIRYPLLPRRATLLVRG
ncbi:hypothetical protein V6N12_050101 [Hibiscus sabdariffa]|uniref:Uncharacterized protein n=1 Tax=Hibiscus sabdariffa TaxID=183260 RepID=A0ABR2GBV4_9ROSI